MSKKETAFPTLDRAKIWRRPPILSLARVEAVERLSPAYMRVTLSGPDLGRFAEGGLHFRLLFGPAGAGWPGLDEAGSIYWPGGIEAWHRPVYTTRKISVSGAAGRIVFDVFRHADGRVTDWTQRVQTGDEIAITGPGGSTLPPKRSWIGLVGDETAIPVIARILAACDTETRGEAALIVPGRADIQALGHPPGVAIRWICRDDGLTPLDALRTIAPPADDRYVFFAAERREAETARAGLSDAGLRKGEFHAVAYWTAPASAK